METKLVYAFEAMKDDSSLVTLQTIEIKVPKPPTRGDQNDYATDMEIRTADGLRVERLEKGKYKIEKTGEFLQSSDPLAP